MTELPPTPEHTAEQDKAYADFDALQCTAISRFESVKPDGDTPPSREMRERLGGELEEALSGFKHLHQEDILRCTPYLWEESKNKFAKEYVWGAIKEAILKTAELPPTRSKEGFTQPWSNIELIRYNARDDRLKNLAEEAIVIAHKNMAKVDPSAAIRIAKPLLNLLHKNPPQRETVIETAQGIIKSRDKISKLLTDKMYLTGSLDEEAKQAIKAKFYGASNNNQVTQLILDSVNTPRNIEPLTDVIGRDEFIKKAKDIPTDAILSLMFDERAYQSYLHTSTPKEQKKLAQSIDWNDFIPTKEENAPVTQ